MIAFSEVLPLTQDMAISVESDMDSTVRNSGFPHFRVNVQTLLAGKAAYLKCPVLHTRIRIWPCLPVWRIISASRSSRLLPSVLLWTMVGTLRAVYKTEKATVFLPACFYFASQDSESQFVWFIRSFTEISISKLMPGPSFPGESLKHYVSCTLCWFWKSHLRWKSSVF